MTLTRAQCSVLIITEVKGGDRSAAWDTIPEPNNCRLLTGTDVKVSK